LVIEDFHIVVNFDFEIMEFVVNLGIVGVSFGEFIAMGFHLNKFLGY